MIIIASVIVYHYNSQERILPTTSKEFLSSASISANSQVMEAIHHQSLVADVFDKLTSLQHKEVPAPPLTRQPLPTTYIPPIQNNEGTKLSSSYLSLPGFSTNNEEYILHSLIERAVFPPFPPHLPLPPPPHPPEELHITTFLLGHPSVRPNTAAESETFWRVDEPYRSAWEKAVKVMNLTEYLEIGTVHTVHPTQICRIYKTLLSMCISCQCIV